MPCPLISWPRNGNFCAFLEQTQPSSPSRSTHSHCCVFPFLSRKTTQPHCNSLTRELNCSSGSNKHPKIGVGFTFQQQGQFPGWLFGLQGSPRTRFKSSSNWKVLHSLIHHKSLNIKLRSPRGTGRTPGWSFSFTEKLRSFQLNFDSEELEFTLKTQGSTYQQH